MDIGMTPQELDKEWLSNALLDHETCGLTSDLPPEEYWRKVSQLKTATGLPMFDNLWKVKKRLLVLPFSNVIVERLSSEVKNIKTKLRLNLKTVTLKHVLYSK